MGTSSLIAPPHLRPGDRIGIVAPARKISLEELRPAMDRMQAEGYEVVLGEHLFGADHQFSGSDQDRRADLQYFLDDPSIHAIIAARGGYGSMRIVDGLDFTQFAKHPKWIIGYSDITVLHSQLFNLGFQSIHGTMPINFSKSAEATDSLFALLKGQQSVIATAAHSLNRQGLGAGRLLGGNLSLIYALTGSKSDVRTDGCVLFLEDLDEYLYHIDRMMMNLKRSGKLERLAGLVIGGMTDMKDNTIPFGKTAEEIILEHVKDFSYPVCFEFPAGHIDRNLALQMGAVVELNLDDSGGQLRYQ